MSLSKLEAFEEFNSILTENNQQPLSFKQLEDFGFTDGVTLREVSEAASDYLNDLHTERNEEKNACRYQH